MTRTATLHRKTGETDVNLTLTLDGTGNGSRETGVGFLDHMLDLLARHGRLDLEVEVTGDLQTGAHHTVEDTGIVLGQAINEALAPRVRNAGCLFVGIESGTAFGDYVAGSNHTLPTGGAARFASGLSARHFRRRMSEVRIGDAADALARAGVPIAEAEGFTRHAASMRVRENPER